MYGVARLAIYLQWSQNKTRRIRTLAGVTAARPRKKYTGYSGKPEVAAPANHLHDLALFKNVSRPQDGMVYAPMTQANAWAQDFTYLRIRTGMFYLALVLDLTTREVVGWKLGSSHSAQLTHTALIQALQNNPPPRFLHNDRGSEYLSARHLQTCLRFGIQPSASRPGSPWQNGYMERAIKSIKEELGTLADYSDVVELYLGVAKAVDYYNNERIHTALKMSPRAYARTLAKPRKHLKAVFGKRVG